MVQTALIAGTAESRVRSKLRRRRQLPQSVRIVLSELVINALIILPALHVTAIVVYLCTGRLAAIVVCGVAAWFAVAVAALIFRSTRPSRTGERFHPKLAAGDLSHAIGRPGELDQTRERADQRPVA